MKDLLHRILSGRDLTAEESRKLLELLTDPETSPAQSAAALVGLRCKGETAQELRTFAMGLRQRAMPAPVGADAVDIVGTGGDGSGSLNLSTGAALITAAAGCPVIKHGNRSISSRCGSFDVLTALGLDLPWDAAAAQRALDDTGFTFLFAPLYHPAMATVAPVRRALGVRTIFNLAGPLANPANPPYALLGAPSQDTARLLAEAVAAMPVRRAYVIHGAPGWDEPTPVGPYLIYEVEDGIVEGRVEDPADFGIPRCRPEDLLGDDSAFNSASLRRVLDGEPGPHRDALILGASLALRVSEKGLSIEDAITRAHSAIDTGAARVLVDSLRRPAEVRRG